MDSQQLTDISGLVTSPHLLGLQGRLATSVKAAYKYDRKCQDAFDDVAGARNPSYGRPTDNIVCRIEFEVLAHSPLWKSLKGAGDVIRQAALQEVVNEAQAKLDAAQAALNELKGPTNK